ncbi:MULTISPECIES: carbamoyltransferase C-terminal domain-containing protein [unclassified Lentimonas]|uniref:carbamoyltransferase family protein n=1 Tax=unclassified Lentimonas TaxID=2630993 RepID=UPI0013296ED1|nr:MULTISPECIES: carbamoyltransferase C-terminal domain-containing protein [unclassified Lentimonas]CAA6676975.1 Carbamoyltransferase in large core OS assembly cluster [Lentimonas sp. CC4]CAA6686781.1 Carbamoyltransferase in large core OS assembly cluster [Lentimonas sp. CC6]CAA7075641.1 Carbamoyltransferase in large core OS assembly cluster [Lentimonas sp. CC4]CAA7168201.1 Carbamoyltransferase in large core OS assembly cluster [Lentimonas sp. CC21]CAA7181648.1 Carbamoyltransferase in large co
MNILGLGGAVGHDPATALFIDGELVAAVEEERLIRDKHAKGKTGVEATKYCLKQAGLKPTDIDIVAYPFAAMPFFYPGRWAYAKRYAYAPDRALTAIFNGNRRFNRNKQNALAMLEELGFDMTKTKFQPVEHHMAHASSAYHLSGFEGKTAILGIDGKGEYATTFFGYAENGKIHKIKEFYDPDSLGGVYGALTEFLGFDMLDGEFKVMGMAPYGDPKKYDFSRLIEYGNGEFKVNTDYVNVIGNRRYKENGKGYYFSPKLIEWLGPKRQGDEIDDPYIDYAASIQQLLEDVALHLIEYHLGDILKTNGGKLAFAGGVALNVKLNQRIMALDYVKELFVQPAASDAGTAIGAASYAAVEAGETIQPQKHAYLGPAYTTDECIEACKQHPAKPEWEMLDDPSKTGAQIMAAGNPLSWMQGRLEFGPRSLGNRSILGDPSYPGVADRINEQIKYRERWRPFCPSMLDTVAEDLLQSDHPAPYMTFTFDMAEHWKPRVPEVVHEDGTARAQIVTEDTNPRYYALLKELESLRGHGVCLNTSLNRRGEPMVCSPTDALNMLYGSDLQFLIMENILIRKAGAPEF